MYIPLLALSVIFSNMSAFLGTVSLLPSKTSLLFIRIVGGLAALDRITYSFLIGDS